MESFKTLEALSYYDSNDIESVSIIDAVYCMKELIKELREEAIKSEDLKEFITKLKKYK